MRKRYGNSNRLIGKYIIVTYYRNNGNDPRYLADHDYEEYNWTRLMCNAKVYVDLTAARIKCENLKYTMNPIYAEVMRVDDKYRLTPVRKWLWR